MKRLVASAISFVVFSGCAYNNDKLVHGMNSTKIAASIQDEFARGTKRSEVVQVVGSSWRMGDKYNVLHSSHIKQDFNHFNKFNTYDLVFELDTRWLCAVGMYRIDRTIIAFDFFDEQLQHASVGTYRIGDGRGSSELIPVILREPAP